MDVSGIQKIPGGGYIPLPDGASYFANTESADCGVPTFPAKAEDAAQEIGEIVRIFLEAVVGQIAEVAAQLSEIWGTFLAAYNDSAEKLSALEELVDAAVEETILPTKRDRIEWRKKQRAVERANAARFRQYQAGSIDRQMQKRTGKRRREWHGPWKENGK